MKPPTKQLDPDLARFCQELADVAGLCGDATNALLINANRVRLNLDIPCGGTVLLLRFPAAATSDRGINFVELLAGRQPKQTPTIHPNQEPQPNPEVQP